MYSTYMDFPEPLKKFRKNPKFLATWPYFLVESFNRLPEHIRANLGTYAFKSEVSSHFYGLCQHPFKKSHLKLTGQSTCKRCSGPKNHSVYEERLDIRRTVNKYKMLETTDKFFQIESFSEMQAHRITSYHHQAKFFRLKYGELNTKKLISEFGPEIIDWYPIDTYGNKISDSQKFGINFGQNYDFKY